MRRREVLMVIALLTVALDPAKADRPGGSRAASPDQPVPGSEAGSQSEIEVSPSVVPPEPSPLVSRDKALREAYFKTLRILSTTNECSHFFGGPKASVEVFKQLIGRVEKHVFPTSIGMNMSGQAVNILNSKTRTQYRLFDKVSINTNGPFYRNRLSLTSLPLNPIGSFEANTEEIRVLMLLHELGHMMKGDDGKWLLPNDGKDETVSRLNSQKIEHICGEQIKAVRKQESKGNGGNNSPRQN